MGCHRFSFDFSDPLFFKLFFVVHDDRPVEGMGHRLFLAETLDKVSGGMVRVVSSGDTVVPAEALVVPP